MPTARRPSQFRAAFTLVELMVSVALVLILILGVNAVFKLASDTIHIGQALSAADRENRAIQSVLFNDFQTAQVTNGPMLLIRSEQVYAYRNRLDEQEDRDATTVTLGPRTVDMDNNNTEGEPNVRGERIPPSIYNSRNHRVDQLTFFANHLFRRQTGTTTATNNDFLDDATSNDAMIWYGHAKQPNGQPQPATVGRQIHKNPGERPIPTQPNPNNYYATDWILGRSVTLLRDIVPPGQSYIGSRPLGPSDMNLTPLSRDSRVFTPTGGTTTDQFGWSVCDMANIGVSAFRDKLTAYADWWKNPSNRNFEPWWVRMGNERFQAFPYPDRPLTSYGLARTAPVLVRGCTHFVVEYAGDYISQHPETGDVLGTVLSGTGGTDGVVDYLPVTDGAPGSAIRARRVRWYGMPRNVDTSDDLASGPMIMGALGAGNNPNANALLKDVVPLRDVLTAVKRGSEPDLPTDAAFFPERFSPNFNMAANYAGTTGGMAEGAVYYAAWEPGDLVRGAIWKPKMIRITLTVDDPNGRLTDGQTYEYVFDLP